MKKEELVSRIQNYMNVQKEYQQSLRNAKGRKRFAVLDFFANNFGGRTLSGSIFGVIGYIAALPLGIFALIPMVAASVLGFFVPKLVEKINLKLMGKFGRKYAKQYLGEKADSFYAYHLICQKELLEAKNFDEVSKKDLSEFCKTVKSNHNVYDSYLKEVVSDKIEKRYQKDYHKIVSILNKEGYESKNAQAKIERIIQKNEEVLKPWCDLQNECGAYASKIADCAKEFNPNIEVLNKKLYSADSSRLRKQVEQYIDNNMMKSVECNISSLFEDSKQNQRLTKYVSKNNEKEENEDFDKKLYN